MTTQASIPGDLLPRTLGVRGGAALIVGNILGMGIFLTPAEVAGAVETPTAYLTHWLIGALVAVAGGLVVAELGVLFPSAGGDYVFLDRAFGRPVAVAWGWLSLAISFAASIAAMAVGLGETIVAVPALATLSADLGASAVATAVAVAAVVASLALNALSVPLVGRVQVTLALLLLLAFAGLGVVALAEPGVAADAATGAAAAGPSIGVGGAMTAVFFTYSGWNVLCYLGGDVRSPARTIPRAVLAALAAVAALYLLLNIAALHAFGLEGLRATKNVGVALATRVLGPSAGDAFGLAVAVAIFAGLNSSLMAASRIALAMSRDGRLPRQLGRLHPRWHTPWSALLAVAAWVIVLIASGSFGALVTLSGSTMIALSALSVSTLFVFRHRDRRVLRLPGYPWVPSLYLAFAAVVLVVIARADPLAVALGLAAFALLVAALWRWDGRAARAPAPPAEVAAADAKPATR